MQDFRLYNLNFLLFCIKWGLMLLLLTICYLRINNVKYQVTNFISLKELRRIYGH